MPEQPPSTEAPKTSTALPGAALATQSWRGSSYDRIGHIAAELRKHVDIEPVIHEMEIVRYLACGGLAEIWLAREEAGFVAVKCVHPEATHIDLKSLRLYREVADDPAIGLMPIQHIGRCERTRRLYYTMPLADSLNGRTFEPDAYEPATLSASIKRAGGMSLEAILAVSRDVLTSLGRLHATGLVHRDIKPSNILRFHGRWCLSDTDLMVREDGAAGSGSAGTPGFAPPCDDGVNRNMDLYAFGKTLYAMLNGNIASFPAAGPGQLLGARRGAYRRLYGVIEKACRERPSMRYRTASDMLADIERTLGARARIARILMWLSLAVVILALGLWGGVMNHRAAPNTISATQGELQPEFDIVFVSATDEQPRRLSQGHRLHTHDSIVVESAVAPRQRATLILATYVGTMRSVQQYEPLQLQPHGQQQQALFAFGFDASGRAVGFELPDEPAPFLALVIPSSATEPVEHFESVVEAVLESSGLWPVTRPSDTLGVMDLSTSMRINGGKVEPWYVAGRVRGGPRLDGGVAVREAAIQDMIAVLSRRFTGIHGVWTVVHAQADDQV